MQWRDDPVLFFEEVLGQKHWSKQIEIARAVAKHRKVSVRSANGVGKSHVAADIALWFLYSFPNSIVVTTAPTFRQVEKVLWGEIKDHHARALLPLGGTVLGTQIKIDPKWYAIGFSSTKESNFQGYHSNHVLFIVDEPTGVKRETFQAIEGSLANEHAKLLMIGNPVEDTGYFRDSFDMPSVHKIHIDALDSPNVKAKKTVIVGLTTYDWCEERKKEWGEDSAIYQARVRGNFPKESSDTLIPLAWIEKSTARWRNDEGTPLDKLKILDRPTLGIDVARKGLNKTTLITRKGRRLLEKRTVQGMRTTWAFENGKEMAEKWGILPEDISVDCIGVGGGVGDMFYAIGWEVREVEEIGAQEKSRFANRRSELAWIVREEFRNDNLDIMPDDTLAFQCSHMYFEDLNGKILVMSKSLMKKKQLESPDDFDALALTYAGGISKRREMENRFYSKEFDDKMHVREVNLNEMRIGTSKFMVLVPRFNGSSVLLWALADKSSCVFFYREMILARTSSTEIERAIREAEGEDEIIYERYIPKLYKDADKKHRFTLIEQLDEVDLSFEEIEYSEEVATINIREGLKFDREKTLSVNNMPHLFFAPSCIRIVSALKSYTNEDYTKNTDLVKATHEAVALMVLAEPEWVPRGAM